MTKTLRAAESCVNHGVASATTEWEDIGKELPKNNSWLCLSRSKLYRDPRKMSIKVWASDDRSRQISFRLTPITRANKLRSNRALVNF